MNINVLTVCTKDQPNLYYWETSLILKNYKAYEILGYNEKWGGWDYRTKKYIEKIKTLQPSDIVITCDANDLYFVEDHRILLEKYILWENQLSKNYNIPVIIGAEPACCTGNFSKDLKLKKYAMEKSKIIEKDRYRYPNGGFVMGRSKYLLELYSKLSSYKDDQEGMLDLYLKNPSEFYLDVPQNFVGNCPCYNYNVCGDIEVLDILPKDSDEAFEKEFVDNWKVDNGKLINSHSNKTPSVIHFPGSKGLNTDIPLQIFDDVVKNNKIIFCTSFIDIGRGDFTEFNRTSDTYINWFGNLIQNNLDIVCFCDDNIKKELNNRFDFYNTYPYDKTGTFYDYYDIIKKIMSDAQYKSLVKKREGHPPVISPDYSIIISNKILLIERLSKLKPGYEYYAWIDFGYCRDENSRSYIQLFDYSKLQNNKVTVSANIKELNNIGDILSETSGMRETIRGGMIIVPKNLINSFVNIYKRKVLQYLHLRVFDCEQNILAQIYRDYPDIFNCKDTDWFDLLKMFNYSIGSSEKYENFINITRYSPNYLLVILIIVFIIILAIIFFFFIKK